jgi:hypothetical protein
MTQANDPKEVGSFALWFDEVKEGSSVEARIRTIQQQVLSYASKEIALSI